MHWFTSATGEAFRYSGRVRITNTGSLIGTEDAIVELFGAIRYLIGFRIDLTIIINAGHPLHITGSVTLQSCVVLVNHDEIIPRLRQLLLPWNKKMITMDAQLETLN
jgi:hypothetical protein